VGCRIIDVREFVKISTVDILILRLFIKDFSYYPQFHAFLMKMWDVRSKFDNLDRRECLIWG
jgi:hypothetical protein